uniref:ATP-dependent DNA helicase n=1 Tax=Tanacetum cinerariifolium TaxID=118510 RepID=A0A699HNA2_TANCI|nr:DNA helicase [Tanacetum cinerariifolium]
MITKMKQNKNNFQTILKNMERKIDEWSKSQNVSLEQTDRTDPPPPQAHNEHVNVVFTGSENSHIEGNVQQEGHHPHFLQLYVYDTRDELSNRMHHFGGLDESTLNPDIIKGLIHVLDEHNGLVRLFRTKHDRCNASDTPSFKIRLYNMGGVRGYELPTTDVLGALVFENGPRSLLYTIEFQKSRWPHCHTLLWVDSKNTLKDAPQIDEYISAEIPVQDPRVSTTKQIDEIQNYVDGRFICPYEAYWRIFDFPIHYREPTVQILNVHLEDMQRINFRERDRHRISTSDGRTTTHSRFKLPLELTDVSFCHAKKKTQLGNLLVETNLIIWDEAPMNDKRCFKTLNRTLRDLMDAPNILFGGKTIVLGGDFRQTLLVKKGAEKEELIAASIAASYLWWHFKNCTLKENLRLQRPGLTNEEHKCSETFAKWLLDVGDGEIGEPEEEEDQCSS